MFISDLLSRPGGNASIISMISEEADALVEDMKSLAEVDEDYQVILKAMGGGGQKQSRES